MPGVEADEGDHYDGCQARMNAGGDGKTFEFDSGVEKTAQ